MNKPQVLEQIGIKLKDLRKKNNMTVRDVAAAAGVSISTISNLENGIQSITLVNLIKIADVFKMPVISLLSTGEIPLEGKKPQQDRQMDMPRNGIEVDSLKALSESDRVGMEILTFDQEKDYPLYPENGGYHYIYLVHGEVELLKDGVVTNIFRRGDFGCYKASQALTLRATKKSVVHRTTIR